MQKLLALILLTMAVYSGYTQFRPTMPLRPFMPPPLRPPVQVGSFSGQLGMSGGMMGVGGGMTGMMGMQGGNINVGGMGIGGGGFGDLGGMQGGAWGNNNPYGAYTPGTVIRPLGQNGPYSVKPIQPGYMIGQQGMSGFGGQFGLGGGMNGVGGGQFGLGGGMNGVGGGQFGLGGGGQLGNGFGGNKGFGFNGANGL
jgi:hypothetical protein